MSGGPISKGLGKWSGLEKWSVGLAIAFVLFAIVGGNTSSQWTGLIWALGSLGLLAWLFSIPIALVVVGYRLWHYWIGRERRAR